MDRAAAAIFEAVLRAALARHGGKQIFVFGAEGSPFWAAHPATSKNLEALDVALRLIEALEASRPKPFFEYDARNAVLVGALSAADDVYMVVLDESLAPLSAEARVAVWRRDLEPHLEPVRREIRAAAAS